MIQPTPNSTGALWARFRFSVVGSLLSSHPARGMLYSAIRSLAAKTWSHPVTGREARFSAVTIARWYYTARRERDDPVGAFAAPCARTAARYPWQRPWLSSSIFSTAITRIGAINFTTTISPPW